MFDFSGSRKADAILLEKLENTLWHVEGQIDAHQAILECLISRLDASEREALCDAALKKGSGDYPAWMSDSGRTVYLEIRTKVINGLTLGLSD
jgi:hypothetical protein